MGNNSSDQFKLPKLLHEKENRDENYNRYSLIKRKNNFSSMFYCSSNNMEDTNKQYKSNQSNFRKMNRIIKSGKSSSTLDLRQEFIEVSSDSPVSSSYSQLPSSPLRQPKPAQNNLSATNTASNENLKFQTPKIGYSTVACNKNNNNRSINIIPLNKRKNKFSLKKTNDNNIHSCDKDDSNILAIESTLFFNDDELISNDLLLPMLYEY